MSSKTISPQRRSLFIKRAGIVLAFIVTFYLGVAVGAIYNPGTTVSSLPAITPTTGPHETLTRDNLLIKVNEARLKEGLVQYGDDPRLSATAQDIANKVNASGDCTHEFLRQMRLTDNKIYQSISETISCDAPNASAVIEGFLSSPTHRDIILNTRLHNMGVGVAGSTVVLHFLP